MAAYRLFLSGLALMTAFALGHLGGFFQAAFVARHDPRMAEVTRAMRAQKSRLLGFEPSLLDFREYFSVNFSVLLVLSAAIGFASIFVSSDRAATVRTLAPIYVVGMSLLLGTSVVFSVVQGILSCSLIGMLFALAWWFA